MDEAATRSVGRFRRLLMAALVGSVVAAGAGAGIRVTPQTVPDAASTVRSVTPNHHGHVHGLGEGLLERWQTLAAAPCARAARPVTRGLAVGIGDYRDPRLPRLMTHNDLAFLREALEARAIDELEVLQDSDATASEVRAHLTDLLEASRCGDRIVLTWSGLGHQSRAVAGRGRPDRRISLMPAHDAVAECEAAPCPGWFTQDDLADFVIAARNRGVEVLLFMDACHGLDLADVSAMPVWTHPAPADAAPSLSAGASDFAAFFAAGPDSPAQEIALPDRPGERIGAFTFALATALQDETVRTPRLLGERIVEHLRDLAPSQRPLVMSSSPDGPLLRPAAERRTRGASARIELVEPGPEGVVRPEDGTAPDVRGRIEPAEGLRAVLVGQEPARVQPDGRFRGHAVIDEEAGSVTVTGVFDDFSVSSRTIAVVPRRERRASPLLDDGTVVIEHGQERGFESDRLRLRSYALIVGNSEYRSWETLNGVPGDVHRLREALRSDRGGFDEVWVRENLDADDLERTFESFIDRFGYRGDGELVRLFIYFAGHGFTFDDARNREGYIVPVDAPSPHIDATAFRRKALHFGKIRALMADIDAQHVLLAFDSCFAGRVLQARSAGADFGLMRQLAYPSRRYLTAGGPDEEVPDPSGFAAVLASALQSGTADANRDGHTTGGELSLHLMQEVPNLAGDTQPQSAKAMSPEGASGEFVFFVGRSGSGDGAIAPPQ